MAGSGTIYNDTEIYRWLSKIDTAHHVDGNTPPCEMDNRFAGNKWLKRADPSYEPPTVYGEPEDKEQPNPQFADVRLAFKLKQSQIRPDGDNERDFKRSFIAELSSGLGVDPSLIEIKELKRSRVKAGTETLHQGFEEKIEEVPDADKTKDTLSPPESERIVLSFRLVEACTLLGPKVPDSMYRLRRLAKDPRSCLYRVSERRDTDACSKLDPLIKPDIKVWEMNDAESAAFKAGVHMDSEVTLMRFFRCFTGLYGTLTDDEFTAKMAEYVVAAKKIVEVRQQADADALNKSTY